MTRRAAGQLSKLPLWSRRMNYSMPVGVACLLLVVCLQIMRVPFLERVDYGIYDIFLKDMATGEPSSIPVLIDIDERSIKELGQWPWPRYRIADLLIALNEYGIAATGIDILMTEPDRTSPELWIEQMKAEFGVEPDDGWLPPELMNNDDYLASIIKQLPVVVAAQLVSDNEGAAGRPGAAAPVIGRRINERRQGSSVPHLWEFIDGNDQILAPIPSIAEAASAIGLMNAEGDSDGVFRRAPLFMAWNETPIPSLALATLALGAGNKSIIAYVAEDGPTFVTVAGIDVPVSYGGTLPVAFRGEGGLFPSYSAVDVLNGEVRQEELAGRIAFLGSTSAGLKDLRPTPFDRAYPGLELHAAVVDTILSERFILTPLHVVAYSMTLVVVTGLISMFFFSFARPQTAFPVGGVIAAGVWFGSRYLMTSAGYYVTPLYSLIAVFSEAFIHFSLRFWKEEKGKRMLRRAFSNYVSPEIVAEIIEAGDVGSLRGQQRDISVLFTDLRGFTSMTEKMAPTQVVDLLGLYFTPMTSIVRDSRGTLDKFVGDAMMAFWNAPTNVPDHPYRAVRSLLDMHSALEKLNRRLEPEFGVRLKMGGGIHTGTAHVGNMGTLELMDYTAIGDTVNTASRLEGLCSRYGVGIVISKNTADSCLGRVALKSLDLIRVKGRVAGIPVFTVCELEEAAARHDEFHWWEDAFALYMNGDFAAAGKICSNLAAEYPNEKLYRIFAERAEVMIAQKPDEWDGIFTYENK